MSAIRFYPQISINLNHARGGFTVKKLILLCSTAAVLPTAAFAQSSSTQDFEKKGEEVIVTATRQQQVGGALIPDTPKAKAVLTQQYIARQNPGQTVLDTINAVPGVSFQNNDAYGSSGGTLNNRGFDSARISLTDTIRRWPLISGTSCNAFSIRTRISW